MDWSRLKGKLGQIDQPPKSNQLQKNQTLEDKLKEVHKELFENGSAIAAERQKILDLLKSKDKKSVVDAVESHCTKLKNYISKSDELNKRFSVIAKALAAQLKAQEENSSKKKKTEKKACGLCGKTENLTKSKCCDQWICDDEDQYIPHTFAKNSCYRNHERYTLCNSHFSEKHSGKWQNCYLCQMSHREDPVSFVWYVTNAYNFEKLDIPKILIKCKNCNFESYELEDFACSVSPRTGPIKYFCKKEKCLKDPDVYQSYVPGKGFQCIHLFQ